MAKHEEKFCPRCNRLFECKVGTILNCQCFSVRLNEKERDYLESIYDDCLCSSCMKAVRADYHNNLLKNKLNKILGFKK